jgi:hypothetical protein
MKKLILILMVLFTTIVSAQKQYSIYATQSADWNGSIWVYGEEKENDMKLIVHGRTALITDQAKSSYYCYKEKDENSFYAWDEKNRKCIVYFTSLQGQSLIGIMYDDFLIRYFYQ